MSLFIIGHTKTGKSVLAKKIAKSAGWTHIPMSEWIRSKHPDLDTQALTQKSKEELLVNPSVCRNFILNKYEEQIQAGAVVLEGCRNPEDFIYLYNPQRDSVLFLDKAPLTTLEETGIEAIKGCINWRKSNSLLLKDSVMSLKITGEQKIWDEAFEWAISKTKEQCFPIKSGRVHIAINPIEVNVNSSYLQDMDPDFSLDDLKAKIIGISSYKDHELTVTLLINNHSIFEYIPFRAISFSSKYNDNLIPENLLVQKNCASGAISIIKYPIKEMVNCYFNKIDRWVKGDLLFTVDWHQDNELLNIVQLKTGQLAAVPHHKIQVGDNQKLPNFKKLRHEWVV